MSLPSSRICVFECPEGFYGHPLTQFCLLSCPAPYYADPSTRGCVTTCPLNQLLYADNITRTCVTNCPSGTYSYQWSINCLTSCPIAVPPYVQTYAADYIGACVVECAYPYYADTTTLRCVSSCPSAFYNDLNTHRCLSCPLTCNTCVSSTMCTSCITNYYLQFGSCVSSCQSLYYANTVTQTCGVSNLCSPSFGMNSTGMCAPSCMPGQYGNLNVYRCDACPSTCLLCTSLSLCQACVALSVFANNYCYGFCNTTNSSLKYFSPDNSTCTDVCPNATYASIVFCLACSPTCGNCSQTATNCTSCPSGSYLYGNICVTSCPTLTKPNLNLTCIPCNGTCDGGLTFGTNITTVNGQPTIYMTFSDAVSFSGNLYQTISVGSSTGRLLATGSNPGYQIIVVNANTVQIVFPPGTSASNYNIKITNPLNIVSSNGNLLSNLGASVLIDSTQLYSTSISGAPNSFPLYFTFLGVICVVSFIFDLELMRFLQLLYVHYFVWTNFPPEFINVFIGLKYSTLSYLPRVFNVEDVILRPEVPSSVYNTVGDYNFLRNAGFAFTPLIVILGVWALLKILTLPEINRWKRLRLACGLILA